MYQYYTKPTLADITVEQYASMARAISIDRNPDFCTGRPSPALFRHDECSEQAFRQLLDMRLIRFEDCLHYVLTPEGLRYMEMVEGRQITIINS